MHQESENKPQNNRPRKKEEVRTCTCRECNSIFMMEEVQEGLFFWHEGLCVACKTLTRLDELGIEPPPCFGLSYNPSTMLCTSTCKINKACRIRSIQDIYEQTPPKKQNYEKKQTIMSHVLRVVRAIGRPIHFDDLISVIESETSSEHDLTLHYSRKRTERACSLNPDIIKLGDSFVVWASCWDLQGGQPGQKPSTHKVKTVKQILNEIEEKSEEADKDIFGG